MLFDWLKLCSQSTPKYTVQMYAHTAVQCNLLLLGNGTPSLCDSEPLTCAYAREMRANHCMMNQLTCGHGKP